jgi:hypothetical protein
LDRVACPLCACACGAKLRLMADVAARMPLWGGHGVAGAHVARLSPSVTRPGARSVHDRCLTTWKVGIRASRSSNGDLAAGLPAFGSDETQVDHQMSQQLTLCRHGSGCTIPCGSVRAAGQVTKYGCRTEDAGPRQGSPFRDDRPRHHWKCIQRPQCRITLQKTA